MFNSSYSSAHYAEIMSSSKANEGYIEMQIEDDLRPTWESLMQNLENGERIILLFLNCIIAGLAAVGNILTLYVVFARKQRLLFKICLLSLAMADLLLVLASGTNYISKLSRVNSLLWTLGAFGCSAIPFSQTVAILVSSMSLVAIALDRYLAVLNKSKAKILQSKVFCFSAFFVVWLVSCGISSPMLFSYELVQILVVPDERQEDFYKAYMCMTDAEDTTSFYIILFIFIFVPLLAAFVWLNAVIAQQIWKRRHAPGSQSKSKSKRSDEDSSTLEIKATSETNTSSNVRNNSSKGVSGELKNSSAVSSKQTVFTVQPPTNIEARRNENQRQRRQMRMFKVILVLVFVFLVCRLPNWIFLLYKLSYRVTGRLNWLLMYIFAVMGLLNCMLNPLLYTFLSQTIRITSHVGSFGTALCKLCRREKKASSHYANNQTMFASNVPRKGDGGDEGGVYLGA